MLSVPDGRRVRALVNSTPIRTEGDEIGSVVVTMQDLAPLDEIERMRTAFQGLVGHELRAPLLAIKGSADAALEEEAELEPADVRKFFRIIAEQAGYMRRLTRNLLVAGRIDSGTLSVAPEPSEVAALVERARSTFPERRRPAHRPRRPAGRAAPRDGRPPPHRAGAQQPLVERREEAPESTPIRVAVVREDAHGAVSVSDEGSGVGPSCCRTCSASTLAPARARWRFLAWAKNNPAEDVVDQ